MIIYVIATILLVLANHLFAALLPNYTATDSFIRHLLSTTFLFVMILYFVKNNKINVYNNSTTRNNSQLARQKLVLTTLGMIGLFLGINEVAFSSLSTTFLYEMQMLAHGQGWILSSFSMIAPFTEEFFFRKLLCDDLERKYSYRTALIMSSVLFYVAHFTLELRIPSPSILFLGFACAYAYLKTRLFLLPILIHLGYNIVGVIGMLYMPKIMGEYGTVVNDEVIYTYYNFIAIGVSFLCLISSIVIGSRKLKVLSNQNS